MVSSYLQITTVVVWLLGDYDLRAEFGLERLLAYGSGRQGTAFPTIKPELICPLFFSFFFFWGGGGRRSGGRGIIEREKFGVLTKTEIGDPVRLYCYPTLTLGHGSYKGAYVDTPAPAALPSAPQLGKFAL